MEEKKIADDIGEMDDTRMAVDTDTKDTQPDYRFLCYEDRKILREHGLSMQMGAGTEAKEDDNIRIACYYAMSPEKIKPPKEERDKEGFFTPKHDPYRHDGKGLMSEWFGDRPQTIIFDMTAMIDHLAKEAYEHRIEEMMCEIRYCELKMCRDFAYAQKEEHDAKVEGREPKKQVPSKKIRKKIMQMLTWKYDWIQFYKKECYLFAQYTIEDRYRNESPERILEGLSEEEKAKILAFGEEYDFKKDSADKRDTAAEKELKRKARMYWALVRKRKEKDAFYAQFVMEAAVMPEANRRLIDRMYENAWDIIWQYIYDVCPARVPEPCYDEVSEGDKAKCIFRDVPDEDITAADIEATSVTEGNS